MRSPVQPLQIWNSPCKCWLLANATVEVTYKMNIISFYFPWWYTNSYIRLLIVCNSVIIAWFSLVYWRHKNTWQPEAGMRGSRERDSSRDHRTCPWNMGILGTYSYDLFIWWKAVFHKCDLCNYWGGNSISNFIEGYLRILLHTPHLFNNISCGRKYFSVSLFSGENSSFSSFREERKKKYQVAFLSNWLESLGIIDVCCETEGFLEFSSSILSRAIWA